MDHGPRRVYLCKPGTECETEILEASRRSESLHHPWVFPTKSHEEYESYMERIRTGRTVGFLVRRKSDDYLAGVINVSEPVMGVFSQRLFGVLLFLWL